MHEPTPSRSRRSTPSPRASSTPRPVALVGPGRAGRAVAAGLRVAGWPIVAVAGRHDDSASTRAAAIELAAAVRSVGDVARAAEVTVIATPDAAIAAAASAAVGSAAPGALVVHLAGSRGLQEFAAAAEQRPDVRFAALHPLVSIPSPDPRHLRDGWCAVAGDPDVYDLADALGLQPFAVASEDRVRYHAAATVAANHIVALLGQVERLAGDAGVPFEAFAPLVRGALANCEALGPRAALTGPVARGDAETVAAHLDTLAPEERETYRAVAAEALRLSGRVDPELDARLR